MKLSLEREPSPVASRRGPMTLHGLRVLVVDDNATNRRILHQQLRAWGCRPTEVSGGEEALEVLRSGAHADPFRLVLLDMQMPGLDGEQTARLIKADPDLTRVPLVLLSSIGDLPDVTKRSAAIGSAAALTKPIRQSTLFQVLTGVSGPRSEPELSAELRSAAEPKPVLSLRVLLAEDDAVSRKVAIRLLEKLGCRVDPVSNGREAVAAFARSRYDLVLMDVQMPETDGFAATAEIRRVEAGSGRRTPIVAITAHAIEGDRERCLAAGMDDYLPKPVSSRALAEKLSHWRTRIAA